MRRPEVERELAVFSTPATRRLAIQAIAAHDRRFPVAGECVEVGHGACRQQGHRDFRIAT